MKKLIILISFVCMHYKFLNREMMFLPIYKKVISDFTGNYDVQFITTTVLQDNLFYACGFEIKEN